MHSSIILFASALGAATASVDHAALKPRQTATSTSINRTPEGTPIPLFDTVDAICEPTRHIWNRGTLNEQKAAGLDRYESSTELELSFKDSPFPCERLYYLQASCLKSTTIRRNSMDVPYDEKEKEQEQGRGTPEQIKAERECWCPSEGWDLMEGCTNCGAIHGYAQDSEHTDSQRKKAEWIKQKFCNETLPERNWYFLVNSGEMYDLFGSGGDGYEPGEFGAPDLTGGKTEVSYYYTASASRTGTAASGTASDAEPIGSATAASTADGDVTEITGTITSTTSGGTATATVPLGSAVSSAVGAASSAPAAAADANDLRVGGGLIMAVLGAMALL